MRRAAVVVFVVAAALSAGRTAGASCHAFTVTASPTSALEGGTVTVTVSRDGTASDSSVHVSTVNGSAKSPSDYTKLDSHVEFTSDTSKTLQISIANDALAEGAENFRVHLSDPGGCTGSGYALSNDAVVTIQASDPTPLPTLSPLTRPTVPPGATPKPSPTSTPTPLPTATATFAVSPTSSPTFSPAFAAPEDETGAGTPIGPIVGVIAGLAAAASGAWLLWYRRRLLRPPH